MTDKTENWSASWKSSTNPSKQRKYRENAPLHVKDKLVSANLDPELREELDTRSINLRTGDRVRVMRGDESGENGIVNNIDREDTRVFVDGITVERTDGTEKTKALRPSNLQVIALNVDDERRLEKYEVDDVESIGVDEEEMEEALEEDEENEMMQQMQTGESSLEAEDEEETEGTEDEAQDEETEAEEEETEEASGDIDYNEIVSGTIGDAKDDLQDKEEVDYKAALEAEKNNKNRTTFVEWLENQVDN